MRFLAAGAALLTGAAVHAGTSPVEFDHDLEWLKRSALESGIELEAIEQAAQPFAGDSLPLYLGSNLKDAVVERMHLVVDGAVIVDRTLTSDDATALLKGGLYRLAMIPHSARSLHIELTLRGHDEAAADVPKVISVDAVPEDEPKSAALVFLPVSDGWFTAARVRIDSLRRVDSAGGIAAIFGALTNSESRFAIGDAMDPTVRYARLLLLEHDDLAAAVELGHLRRQAEAQSLRLTADYSLLSGEALLSYGLLDEALTAYQQALVRNREPATLVGLRLDLGDAWLRRGDAMRAEAVLGTRAGTPDSAQMSEWNDLRSRALMTQGRYSDAVALLRGAAVNADLPSYLLYYNLGVGLIRLGNEIEGRTVLDRLGTLLTSDPSLRQLRDRANLALGLRFLKAGQGATAVPVLERISSEGPFANVALLALGQAWLAPDGDIQKQAKVGDERTVGPPPESIGAARRSSGDRNLYQRYQVRPFARAHSETETERKLERALGIWSLLIDRDSSDRAVQEGMLATAEALQQLGAHERAVELLERAIKAIQSSITQAHESEAYYGKPGWAAELSDVKGQPAVAAQGITRLPPAMHSAQLIDIIAGEPFSELVASDQKVGFLAVRLREWSADLDSYARQFACESAPASTVVERDPNAQSATALVPATDLCMRIATLHAAIAPQLVMAARLHGMTESRMSRLLLDDLDDQIGVAQSMLGHARLALARIYDGALP